MKIKRIIYLPYLVVKAILETHSELKKEKEERLKEIERLTAEMDKCETTIEGQRKWKRLLYAKLSLQGE